jgi:proline dehydrogenase
VLDASGVLRQGLLQLSKSDRVRDLIETAPVSRDVVRRFVAGDATPDAVRVAGELNLTGRMSTIDNLGEDTLELGQAQTTRDAYLTLLKALGEAGLAQDGKVEVSIKLSALGQALPADGAKVALDHAREICHAAANVGTSVTLDMEDHTTTDGTLETLRELRQDFPSVGVVLQSYLYRTEADCKDFAHEGSRVRLCKGTYKEPESVAFQDKPEVDKAYVRCLKVLMEGQGYPRSAHGRDRGCPCPQERQGGGHLRVPDALRQPSRGAEADRRPRGQDAGLHPLRPAVVRLPDAPDGRASGQHDGLPACARDQRLTDQRLRLGSHAESF